MTSSTRRRSWHASNKDAESHPAFCAHLDEAATIVRKVLLETPPDPSRQDWKAFKETASLLWRFREHAGAMYRIADLFTQSADQYLSRWFESDVIKAVLAYYSGIGTYGAEVAWHRLRHHAPPHGRARGCGRLGLRVRRHGRDQPGDCRLRRALRPRGQDRGRDRQGLIEGAGPPASSPAPATKSAPPWSRNANAKILFFDLIERRHLPGDFLDELGRFRTFSTAFKINLACERPPQYRAFDGSKCGFAYPSYVHIGPDIEYLERAYDDAKHGWYLPGLSSRRSCRPVDDTIAPPGKHVVHLFGGHAPYRLKNATWEHERANFVRNVMGVMNAFAPGFSDDVIDMQVLLPPDIEEIPNLPNGHIFHGELSVDQLFMQRRSPTSPTTGRRSGASICAARRPIRAACPASRLQRRPRDPQGPAPATTVGQHPVDVIAPGRSRPDKAVPIP